MPSLQLGVAHLFASQRALAHCVGAWHSTPGQARHSPPQSIPVSAPFKIASVQLMALQT